MTQRRLRLSCLENHWAIILSLITLTYNGPLGFSDFLCTTIYGDYESLLGILVNLVPWLSSNPALNALISRATYQQVYNIENHL